MEGKYLVFLSKVRRTGVKSDDLDYFYTAVQRHDNSSLNMSSVIVTQFSLPPVSLMTQGQ